MKTRARRRSGERGKQEISIRHGRGEGGGEVIVERKSRVSLKKLERVVNGRRGKVVRIGGAEGRKGTAVEGRVGGVKGGREAERK